MAPLFFFNAPETCFVATDADDEALCFERVYRTFDCYDGYVELRGDILSCNIVFLFYGIENLSFLFG